MYMCVMSFKTCKPKSGIHLKNGVLYSVNAMLVLCILTMLTLQLCNCKFVNQDLQVAVFSSVYNLICTRVILDVLFHV